MTEYNYFCYSANLDTDGFQKPRYRIFNKEVDKDTYLKTPKIKMKLKFDKFENYSTRYKTAFKKAFEELSQSDKDSITSLPGFNADDFLEYYGVDLTIKELPTYTIEQLQEKLGEKFTINLK